MNAFRIMNSRKTILLGYIIFPIVILLVQTALMSIKPNLLYVLIALVLYMTLSVLTDNWVWSSHLNRSKEIEDIFCMSHKAKTFLKKTITADYLVRAVHIIIFFISSTGIYLLISSIKSYKSELLEYLGMSVVFSIVAVILFMFVTYCLGTYWFRHISNRNTIPLSMWVVMMHSAGVVVAVYLPIVAIIYSILISVLCIVLTFVEEYKKLERRYHD